MLPIQPRRINRADKKLTPVSIRPCVSHGKDPLPRVGKREILIVELVTVNRFPARPVTVSEVPTLTHELRDDAVEPGTLVAEAGLAGAELAEVLGGFRGDVRAELKGYATDIGTAYVHVEEDFGVGHGEAGRSEGAGGGAGG